MQCCVEEHPKNIYMHIFNTLHEVKASRTLQKYQEVRVESSKSSAFLEDLTQVGHFGESTQLSL